MADDEFDQYKVSSPSEDEFAQYKVPSSPAITPPPAAGPHIDMHRSPLLGDPNSDIDEPPVQAFFRGMSDAEKQGKITPAGIAKGTASDLWTLTKAGPQGLALGLTGGKYAPLGRPNPQKVLSAGTNVGVGMLLGGMENEGIPPTQGLNRAINGVPKTPVAGPSLSVAAKLMREVPGIGGALRKFDLLKDLIPEQNVPRGTPPVPTTNGIPWGQGKYGTPLEQWGKQVSAEAKPSVPPDPWANLKFDKAAQEQARTELGAHADTTRVLERAQEIKTQMMQQGSQYQVVKVGTLPKAKGNPFSGPNTPSVMEPAQSTNISLHGYHPESQTLVVQFKNGNVYSYKGVPQEIFDNYRNSESQGSFFANNIKGRYQTELRGTVKPTPGVRVKQALGGQP